MSLSDPQSEELDFDEEQIEPEQDPIEVDLPANSNQDILDRFNHLSDQLASLLTCVESMKAKQVTVEDQLDSLNRIATKSAWYIRVLQKKLTNPAFTIQPRYMTATFLHGLQQHLLQLAGKAENFPECCHFCGTREVNIHATFQRWLNQFHDAALGNLSMAKPDKYPIWKRMPFCILCGAYFTDRKSVV